MFKDGEDSVDTAYNDKIPEYQAFLCNRVEVRSQGLCSLCVRWLEAEKQEERPWELGLPSYLSLSGVQI